MSEILRVIATSPKDLQPVLASSVTESTHAMRPLQYSGFRNDDGFLLRTLVPGH